MKHDTSLTKRIAAPFFTSAEQAEIVGRLAAPICSQKDRLRGVALIQWLQTFLPQQIDDGMGQGMSAGNGRFAVAHPSSTEREGGDIPSQPHRDDAGPPSSAGNGLWTIAPSSLPPREVPGPNKVAARPEITARQLRGQPTDRQKEAARSGSARYAQTLMDSWLMRDGVPIGQVRIEQTKSYGDRARKSSIGDGVLAVVMLSIAHDYHSFDPKKTIQEIMTADDLEKRRQRAEKEMVNAWA